MQFPVKYGTGKDNTRDRLSISLIWFGLAAVFLITGDNWSLMDDPHRNTTEVHHYNFNLLVAFIFLTLGFRSLLKIRKSYPEGLHAVVVSREKIKAPGQGVLLKIVEIRFADVVKLQRLSIDGLLELNIHSQNKHIRVTRVSLEDTEDFERLIAQVQEGAPQCQLEVQNRFDLS